MAQMGTTINSCSMRSRAACHYTNILFYRPICYLRTFFSSFSLPRRGSNPGSLHTRAREQTLLPPPHYGTPLYYYRDKSSAVTWLVGSRQVVHKSIRRRALSAVGVPRTKESPNIPRFEPLTLTPTLVVK